MTASPRVVDLGIAGLLCLIGMVEVAAGSHGDEIWLGVASTAAITAPLAVRRSVPLLPLLVLAATFPAVMRYGEGSIPESVALLAVWVLATYSASAYGGLGLALLGLGVSASLPFMVVALDASTGVTPSDLLFVGVPWLAGLAIRAHRVQASRLEETARQLREEREEHARSAVALERARLARDVHDVVAHTVSSIAVQADAAEATLDADPEATKARLAKIQGAASDALDDLRGLFGTLREEPAGARPQPGLEDLATLAAQAREAGLQVDVEIDVDSLADGRALCVFRVVQEALTNVRRHAQASSVTIRVVRAGAGVRVEVVDDGVGLEAERGAGFGLVGIRERAAAYGGTVEIASAPGQGTSVVMELPGGAG